jgi:OOP family OmpA-OmpF porin
MNVMFPIASLFFVLSLTAQPLNNPFTKLNSEFDELNPVITPDGKTVFFTIANHPNNIGGKKDPGDIWYCTLTDDNVWSEPVHAGPLLNNSSFNGVAGFSGDGNEMFLLTHYDPSGAPARTQGISVSRRVGGQWSRPENIAIPYFQNKSNIISGYISPDKSYFVFSAETYGTYGVEDLFVCERGPDGKWSAPKNLGNKINTQFQEISPSLSHDGKTLYFSTNGRKGKGSFDIFSASRLDDSWTNWSEPENLLSINTEGRDLFYREFATLGYSLFTSTKNSDGYGDVRMYKPETPFPVDSTVLAKSDPDDEIILVAEDVPVTEEKPVVEERSVVVETKPEPAKRHAVQVYGKVTDAQSGETIPAVITFEPQESTAEPATVRSSREGYSVDITSVNKYRLRIEASGYISVLEKLDIESFEMNNLEMNFQLQPIEVGTTVNLRDVLFEQSKTTLLPESYAELDLVVAFLKANPNVHIELSGHTDNRGVPFQNVKLSQGRVDTVRDYLVSQGIDRKRISGKGYGGSKPIASNNTEETRRLNRRVEFTIKKN